jgi:hypothetical protein
LSKIEAHIHQLHDAALFIGRHDRHRAGGSQCTNPGDDMRKFLIIALSLTSLGALTDAACARVKIVRSYSLGQLGAVCSRTGGTFGTGSTSYWCEWAGRGLVECVKGRCISDTNQLGGTGTSTSGGTATGANKGGGAMFGSTLGGVTTPAGIKIGGVTFGSTMSGGTTPAETKGGGPGGVTALAPSPTLLSTGGAFGATKTGPSAGPLTGGIITGRKPW